jgi:hypothetical protein
MTTTTAFDVTRIPVARAQHWVTEKEYKSRLADIAALEAMVVRLEARIEQCPSCRLETCPFCGGESISGAPHRQCVAAVR